MAHGYKHFIPQNIAPKGAKCLGVYNAKGTKIINISLNGLTPPTAEKLYSFGLVSDIHLYDESIDFNTWKPNTKFDNTLSYFEEQGCALCVVCGDLTQTGFYSEDSNKNCYLDTTQMKFYEDICSKDSNGKERTIPVYELAGNHESYYSHTITENIDKWETYTGKGVLSYTINQGDDLFIFLGQPEQHAVMSDEDLNWVIQLLKDNSNKRCFVFVHSYIEEDSGDAGDCRENSIFEKWGTAKTDTFLNAMRGHKNAILFHGHSHMMFECQGMDVLYAEAANYTENNGFKSVHIPSLGRPRTIKDNDVEYIDDKAQGYIVDVYDDFIVLNGMEFVEKKPVPLGVFKINTPTTI